MSMYARRVEQNRHYAFMRLVMLHWVRIPIDVTNEEVRRYLVSANVRTQS